MAKPKLFMARDIPQPGFDMLNEKFDIVQWEKDSLVPREVMLERVKDVDAIYVAPPLTIDTELLDRAKNVKVIGTFSVGLDHIDVPECRKRGIKIGYTPGILTEATAEFTVALLLSTARRIVEGNKETNTGIWKNWRSMWLCGKGVEGSIIGIVGLGRIGASVAMKLRPFNPEQILFFDPYANAEAVARTGAIGVSFEEMLTKSDIVVCCCFLTDETRNLFNKTAFDKMKSDAILINTSRGPVVNQDDLYDALCNGKLGAAGLDVTTPEPLPKDHKLLTLPNCVITPHMASGNQLTRWRMADLTARNIIAGLEGKEMPSPVPES